MAKKHFHEITLMQAVLCLGVVMIHLTAAPVEALTHGSVWHIFMFSVNKALAFCVPAFLFLSGCKLYEKYSGTKMNVWRFWGGRARKIVLPYLLAAAVYFLYLWQKGWAAVASLPEYMFFGTLAGHFYYVILAVQAYLLFPVLRCIFEKFPLTTLSVSLLSAVGFHSFWTFLYSDRCIGAYLFYFVLGMCFVRYKVYERIKKLLPVSAVGAVAVGAVHVGFSYRQMTEGILYRASGSVNIVYVSFAIATLYGVCKVCSEKRGAFFRCAQAVSDISYPVYLWHVLILFLLQYDIFPHVALSVRNRFLISFAVLYALTVLYAFLHDRWKLRHPA